MVGRLIDGYFIIRPGPYHDFQSGNTHEMNLVEFQNSLEIIGIREVYVSCMSEIYIYIYITQL